MLFDCLASCTRGLSPRWESRAADNCEGTPAASVPVPVEAAPETAPGAPQLAVIDQASGPEPPFQIDLGFLSTKPAFETICVTVDHSYPVNVVTKKCLKGLGWKPIKHGLPSELSKLAAEALLAHCGWQRLGLYALVGGKGSTRHIEFVVVGDDYPCDLLLGREFKGVKLMPRPGMYPVFKKPKGKETKETEDREMQQKEAAEAAAATEWKRQSTERFQQLRKKDPKSGGDAGEGTSA